MSIKSLPLFILISACQESQAALIPCSNGTRGGCEDRRGEEGVGNGSVDSLNSYCVSVDRKVLILQPIAASDFEEDRLGA
jgi:hypothetical protein